MNEVRIAKHGIKINEIFISQTSYSIHFVLKTVQVKQK
jgi:hypothetical protein